MLRWCLPTVRVAGGCGRALDVFRTSSSTSRGLPELGTYVIDSNATYDSVSLSHPTLRQLRKLHNSSVAGRLPCDLRRGRQWNSAALQLSSLAQLTPGIETAEVVLDYEMDVGELEVSSLTAADTDQAKDTLNAVVPSTLPPPDDSESSEPPSVDKLRSLLSLRELPIDSPCLTSRTLRHLYYSAKTQSQLSSLSPEDLSSLICLFGSLSICNPDSPKLSIHMHSLVSVMPKNSFRPHWAFIIRVAKDKHALWESLSGSDRYWLMRASLEQSKENLASSRFRAEQSLHFARLQYHKICKNSSHPDLHIPYIQTLLSWPTPEYLTEVVDSLCKLLRMHEHCGARVLEILWQLAFKSRDELPAALKQEVLHTIWDRVDPGRDTEDTNDAVGGTRSLTPLLSGPTSSTQQRTFYVHDLAAALNGTIFDRRRMRSSSQSPAQRQLLDWAASVAREVFYPGSRSEESLELQWNCVRILALVKSSSRGRGANGPQTHDPRSAAIVEWQTTCALVTLENFWRSVSGQMPSISDELARGLGLILDTLWRNWSTALPPDQKRPVLVACAICASFFRLAGRLKNKKLVEAITQYCDTANLWSAGNGDISSFYSVSLLAKEYLRSSALCGGSVERPLAHVIHYVRKRRLLSHIVNTLILHYSHLDVEVARELRALSSQAEIGVSAYSSTALGISLARKGFGALSLQYLIDHRMTFDRQLPILAAILTMLLEHGRRFVHPCSLSTIADIISRIFAFSPPPKHLHHALRHTLLLISRSGSASRAVSAVQAIAEKYPATFPIPFFTSLLHYLLDHRQFRLSKRVFYLGISLYSQKARFWLHMLLSRYSRGGANRIAYRMAKHSTTPQTRPSVSMALVGAIRFSELPPSPVLTLKIPGILSHFGAEHLGATHAVRILVRAGRLRAAKQLYSEVCERQTPSVRTVMGNTILHGSMLHPSRRNARTMRKVLDVLNNLVKGCAFVPDRVTVNILVKTLLRWTKDIDAQKARVLFDRIIRSGYPTGTVEQGSVPFGTEAAASPQGFEIPKLDSSISFVRHVRPLYKMFIKAFYLRGDVHAARTVVGILKAVEAEAMDVERRGRFKIARGLDDNHARTSQ